MITSILANNNNKTDVRLKAPLWLSGFFNSNYFQHVSLSLTRSFSVKFTRRPLFTRARAARGHAPSVNSVRALRMGVVLLVPFLNEKTTIQPELTPPLRPPDSSFWAVSGFDL